MNFEKNADELRDVARKNGVKPEEIGLPIETKREGLIQKKILIVRKAVEAAEKEQNLKTAFFGKGGVTEEDYVQFGELVDELEEKKKEVDQSDATPEEKMEVKKSFDKAKNDAANDLFLASTVKMDFSKDPDFLELTGKVREMLSRYRRELEKLEPKNELEPEKVTEDFTAEEKLLIAFDREVEVLRKEARKKSFYHSSIGLPLKMEPASWETDYDLWIGMAESTIKEGGKDRTKSYTNFWRSGHPTLKEKIEFFEAELRKVLS
jgi:hypothetical protein